MTTTESDVHVGGSTIRVFRAGDPTAPAVVLLHGWPQTARCWAPVMRLASPTHHVVALDLPGVGGSHGDPTDGTKVAMATVVRDVVRELGLGRPVLVGHDIGAMVAYAYARHVDEPRAMVLLDAVIPGVAPWESVWRNPRVWHFGLHAVPELPETLVRGRERAYFDFFFDALVNDGASIGPEAREAYAAGYGTDEALTAGFDWYRAFARDAEDNRAATTPLATPTLYLRGADGMGRVSTPIDDYVTGLREAGLQQVDHALVPGAVHYLPEEAPAATWHAIAGFADRQ